MFERSGMLVKQKFFEYLFPTILTSMAVSLATVVDSAIVGNLLGDKALAAVGLSGPIIYGINMIFFLFAVGGVTCAAIAKGQRDSAKADRLFTLTIIGGFIAMSGYAVVILAFMQPITTSLAPGDPELQSLTAAYLTPLLFVGPAMMLSNGLSMFVRTDGKPKTSAIIAIVANSVNLVLDYVLIRFLDTGIMGAGLSTTLGYAAGIFVVLPYLFSKERSFRFSRERKKGQHELSAMLRTGLPKSLTQCMSLLRSFVLNAIVMYSLGALGMSAMTVCINALMIANIFIGGTSDTLLPIVGTLFGERDYFGIRKTVRSAFGVLVTACIAVMVFFLAAPQVVGGWFGVNSTESLSVLIPALRLYALSLPFYGLNQLLQNFYTTTGRQKLASVIAVLQGFVFVVIFALLLMNINVQLLWLCYLLGELCTLAVIFLLGASLKRKEKTSGFLLLKEQNEEGVSWDVTIPATVQAATGLSAQAINFCKQNGIGDIAANRVGVAIEEMAVNTANHASSKKQTVIDILVRITDEKLIIRFRDNGIILDPMCGREPSQSIADKGIEVVRRLAGNIDYGRQLGLNTTLVSFERKQLQSI